MKEPKWLREKLQVHAGKVDHITLERARHGKKSGP